MLYLVTNRKLASGNFEDVVERSIAGGVDRVILREKDLPEEKLMMLARRVKEVTDEASIPLIVNGSLSVARSIGAWAYHTNFKDLLVNGKRYPRVGVSIHSVEEGLEAEALSADYVLAGHVFKTDCKKGLEPRGLEFIKSLNDHLTIPIVAIGGINPQNAPLVYHAGAWGVATMSYVMGSTQPDKRAREFKEG